MVKPTKFSFGGTAGIVTSMALLVGLDATHAGKVNLIGALLIVAVADNLTDSLSVQMYQESERRERWEAILGTLTNFTTRFFVCLTFVGIVALFWKHAVVIGVIWGMVLLSAMSYIVARGRSANVFAEIAKHVGIAVLVILVSEGIGLWITGHVS
jgi:hypothetical protein